MRRPPSAPVRLLFRAVAAGARLLLIAGGLLALVGFVVLVAGWRLASWPARRGGSREGEAVVVWLQASAVLLALLRQRVRYVKRGPAS